MWAGDVGTGGVCGDKVREEIGRCYASGEGDDVSGAAEEKVEVRGSHGRESRSVGVLWLLSLEGRR